MVPKDAKLDPKTVGTRMGAFVDTVMDRLNHLCAVTGHMDITTLSPHDLIALDYDTASVTGLKLLGFERRLPMWEH